MEQLGIPVETLIGDMRDLVGRIAARPDDPSADEDARMMLYRTARHLPRRSVLETLNFMAQQILPDAIEVDLNTNTAERDGATVKLEPLYASLLWRLMKGYPSLVSVEDLKVGVWGRADSNTARPNTIRVMVSTLRRLIVPLNATIENKHGVGYRLELHSNLRGNQ